MRTKLLIVLLAVVAVVGVGCVTTQQSKATPDRQGNVVHYGVDGWYRYHGYNY